VVVSNLYSVATATNQFVKSVKIKSDFVLNASNSTAIENVDQLKHA
jgi:hypothetical protein